jgi:beta-exotoxin I transport system permease protein
VTSKAVTSKDVASTVVTSDVVAPPVATSNAFVSHVALVTRSLVRARLFIIAACLLLAAFQVVLVVQGGSQFESEAFGRMSELMPAFIRRSLGDLTIAIFSFQGVVTAGYFHPVIVLLVAHLTIYLGTEPAHDVEAGLVDLLLARPVPRHALITRSLLLIAIGAIVAPFTLAFTMWIALHLFAPAGAPWPTARLVFEMTVNLTLVSICFGALALVIASRARRRGIAIASASVLTVLMYLIVFLESTWAPARAIAWISPFHYFHPIGLLAGRVELWRHLVVLASASAGLAAIAYVTFNRRDL